MSNSSEEEAEFTGETPPTAPAAADSEDDVPLAQLATSGSSSTSPASRQRSAKKSVSYNEDESSSEDDDEDDIPLAQLAKKAPPKKTNGVKKKAAPAKKKTKIKIKTQSSTVSTKSNGSSKKSSFDTASDALYNDCEKGQLIQRLLCRWWYAMEWPDPSTLPAQPPKHYDTLDGFSGVYVCTTGDDNIGHVQDLRDPSTAPTFGNLAKKPAEELQQLLVKACDEQLRQLIAAEGPDTDTEKDLKKMKRWAEKLKPAKVDKEANKVLKAQGLSLP